MSVLKNKELTYAALLILIIAGLYFFTPLKDYFSRENVDQFRIWMKGTGPWAPFVFVGLYIVTTIVCLPGSVLTILGGLIFGVAWGTFLVWIASNAAAWLTFVIARKLGRRMTEKLLRGRVGALDERVEKHGFYVVLWFRLIPIFPYSLLNYAFGFTRLHMRDYLMGNILGMFPGTFVYVSLGNAASKISLTDPQVWTKMEVWGPFLLVILLSFLPQLFKQKQKELEKYTHQD